MDRGTLLKTGFAFLFGTFTHLIVVFLSAEHVYWQRVETLGQMFVSGTPISNIATLNWIIIVVEFLISAGLIGVALSKRKKE